MPSDSPILFDGVSFPFKTCFCYFYFVCSIMRDFPSSSPWESGVEYRSTTVPLTDRGQRNKRQPTDSLSLQLRLLLVCVYVFRVQTRVREHWPGKIGRRQQKEEKEEEKGHRAEGETKKRLDIHSKIVKHDKNVASVETGRRQVVFSVSRSFDQGRAGQPVGVGLGRVI